MRNLNIIEKIDSPNAQLLALQKAREEIEEKIRELYNDTRVCECGYRIWNKEFESKKITYFNPYGRDICYVDCPCCGKLIQD